MDRNAQMPFLTVTEVAQMLRLSQITIYKYIQEGKLEANVFGGHYRISQDALNKFIESNKVGNK